MINGPAMFWIALFGVAYLAVTLYWARVSAVANGNTDGYFSAGHALPPWVSAVTLSGAGLSAWFTLGTADLIARDGLGHAALLQAGVLLALTGVLFHKRVWFIGQRLRMSSQVELFRAFFQSEFLAVSSALIALLFAIGFSGLQLRALSTLLADLSGEGLSAPVVAVLLSVLLVGYVVIGGMRAIGFIGVLQTLALVAAILGLGALLLIETGGLGALAAGLSAHGAGSAFEVQGVIRFVAGLGRDMTAPEVNTAVMALSTALAILGFGASPLAVKVILSTRNVAGVAAGHVWFGAAGLGALVVLVVTLLGVGALIAPEQRIDTLLASLALTAPWLLAWLIFGLIAGMQVIAGLSLLVAAESLVRHVYKPLFHSRLSRTDTVALTRIAVVVLAVVTVLMAFLAPLTLSALGGFALPAAAQLIVPMLGLCWFGWLSRSAVLVGFGTGLAAAFLTDTTGIQFLAWLGLDLPWGRWPWTIHAAGWGLFFNMVAALLVAAATYRQPRSAIAADIAEFVASNFAVNATRAVRALGWSAILAWTFLAVGPGLIFGNTAFAGNGGTWLLGLPPLWVWAILGWMAGLGLVWFLAYRLGMAAPRRQTVPVYEPPPVLRPQQERVEQERLRAVIIAALIAAGLITLLVWSFGNAG